MPRQYKNGRCSCWKEADRALGEHGTQLRYSYLMTGGVLLNVATENKTKSRRKPKSILASYCPFCGAKLKTKA